MSNLQIVKLINPIQMTISGTFTPKGAYNAGTDYAVGDQVDYNGSSYIMYADAAAGTVPTNTSYWGLIASKGDTGATGADSTVPGPAGADGLTVSVNSVTQVAGDISLTQDNIPDGTTNKAYTATEQTKLAGIATGATANPNAINNVVEDTTPQLGGNLDSNGHNIQVKGTNGVITITSDTDGGEFNIGSNASGTLAIYGSGGNTLGVKLLDGDIEIGDTAKGVILTAPNASRWRITVDNSGNLTTTSI